MSSEIVSEKIEYQNNKNFHVYNLLFNELFKRPKLDFPLKEIPSDVIGLGISSSKCEDASPYNFIRSDLTFFLFPESYDLKQIKTFANKNLLIYDSKMIITYSRYERLFIPSRLFLLMGMKSKLSRKDSAISFTLEKEDNIIKEPVKDYLKVKPYFNILVKEDLEIITDFKSHKSSFFD